MTDQIAICCPQCHGTLVSDAACYQCLACHRRYPIVFGIPDFRLFPDPYISFKDEYQKACVLAEQANQLSFEDLVRFYWEITPQVPRRAVERYITYALHGVERGKACLEAIDLHMGRRWMGENCVDIGCGTGGFLLASQSRFRTVVGADIALRWLIIAKKRVTDAGKRIILLCCSAEHLPFPKATFDSVVGIHVLEHTQDQQMVLSETARTLRPGGLYFFSTPNRFTLGPEPCVRAWGVGFIPRSLASRYVNLVKGVPYRHIRLNSFFELRRLLTRSGLRGGRISPPRIAECELKVVSGFTRFLITIYHAFREVPVFSLALQIFGPFLQVVGRK